MFYWFPYWTFSNFVEGCVVCVRIANNLFEFSSDIGVRIVFVMIMTNENVIAKGHENRLMQIEFERAQDMMIGQWWYNSNKLNLLTFSILLCTFGRVANIFEFFQCVLLVEVKMSTLKVHFVSLSAHCGNAENTFQHL